MKIRKATEQDRKQILRLVGYLDRCFPKAIQNWRKNYNKYIKGTYVILDKEKIIAYISCGLEPRAVYIGDLYVLPAYRRKGIATKLIKIAENLRKRLKKKYLRIDVREQDKPAFVLYSKLGFKKWKRKPKTKTSWRLRK